MTNTEGGVLYLGVEDNGDITGVHKKHKDPNVESYGNLGFGISGLVEFE